MKKGTGKKLADKKTIVLVNRIPVIFLPNDELVPIDMVIRASCSFIIYNGMEDIELATGQLKQLNDKNEMDLLFFVAQGRY